MHAKSQFPWAKFWKIARSNVSTVEEEEEELIVYWLQRPGNSVFKINYRCSHPCHSPGWSLCKKKFGTAMRNCEIWPWFLQLLFGRVRSSWGCVWVWVDGVQTFNLINESLHATGCHLQASLWWDLGGKQNDKLVFVYTPVNWKVIPFRVVYQGLEMQAFKTQTVERNQQMDLYWIVRKIFSPKA